ncbi:hypothetical protein [Paenibacillus medicaginis]|uniref:GIY-YIG nuclease family protein n=1 Tax=Paenibacillus medicaginis TaxID=1470560 RepID=A0ABV5BXI6_9BACL
MDKNEYGVLLIYSDDCACRVYYGTWEAALLKYKACNTGRPYAQFYHNWKAVEAQIEYYRREKDNATYHVL